MIGCFKIFNKDGEFVKNIHHDNISRDIKKEILEREQYLVCACNSKEDLIYTISSNYRLYPKKQEQYHKHHINCIKHKTAAEIEEERNRVKYVSGREETEEGEIIINPCFRLTKPTKGEKTITDIDGTKGTYVKGSSDNIQGKVALRKLHEDINLATWNNKINKGTIIENKEEFARMVYGQTENYKFKNPSSKSKSRNKITNNKDIILKDIYFNFNKPFDKDISVVYGNLVKIEEYGESKYKIYLSGAYNKHCFFNIDKQLYNRIFNSLKVKETSSISVLAVVCKDTYTSKVSNKQVSYNSIIELSMININDNGLFSESSHEIAFYNHLCKNDVKFTKPFLPIREYENMICDGIIKPEDEEGKVVFIEIFGIVDSTGQLGYNEQKEKKRNLFKGKLINTHKLLEWDVANGQPMPTIEEITDLLE